MKGTTKSFWGLAARSSLPWVGLICGVMTLFEPILFRLLGWKSVWLDQAVGETQLGVFYSVALVSLGAVFCYGGLLRARNDLTLARLRLDRKSRFWVLAGQNALCFGILWAWQAVLAVGLSVWWIAGHGDFTGAHSLFTAFYRSEALHGLLPLGDTLLWVRNLAFLIVMGMVTAKAALSRKAIGPMICCAFAAFLWLVGTNMAPVEWIEIALCVIVGWVARDGGAREPLE